MQEEQLVELLRQGNEKAFRYLVNTYKDRIFNIILHYLPQKEEAEDLLQEVFIELINSIKKFKGQSSLYTWVCRIAINKSLDHIRYKQKKKRSGWFINRQSLDDPDNFLQPGHIKHPGIQMEDRELAELFYAAIDQLPGRQRSAYVLFNLENHSYEEIADILETTKSSVDSLIQRAKAKLRKLLKDYYNKLDN